MTSKKKINHVITIDFETYYDDSYTLTKMPTAQYIRDPRFEVIGVGYQLDAEPPIWTPAFSTRDRQFYPTETFYSMYHSVPGGGPGGGPGGVPDKLAELPWGESTAVAHNAMFDGFILAYWYDLRPAKWFCTSMATRPLLAAKLGSTSLAKVSEYFGIGQKGTEVVNAKGKNYLDFTAEELAAYGEYCKNDVRLSYIIFQLMTAWYEKHNVPLA